MWLSYLYFMITKQYELAIELERGGEWICDVTVHEEEGMLRYEIEVDPPIWIDGKEAEPFPMEMRYNDAGELLFITQHPLTEDLTELEEILAREIISEAV